MDYLDVMIISASDPAAWPIYTKSMGVMAVAERITVTNAETMKMVATPILYENFFFICV